METEISLVSRLLSSDIACWMLYSVVVIVWNIVLLYFLLRNPHNRVKKKSNEPLNIVFLHPELVQGGAEKLVVEYASNLRKRGHSVQIYTGFHDSTKSFNEVSSGLISVVVHGMWMPRSLFGYFNLPCTLLKMTYLSICLMLQSKRGGSFDIIFVDQVPSTIPLLKWTKSKIIYYCHFPDMLLSERSSLIKRIYRMPLDKLEEWTTAASDLILVNSKFTLSTFKNTFRNIQSEPIVLYPNVGKLDNNYTPLLTSRYKKSFLSLNRFDRKKNIMLAIDAFNTLLNKFEYGERKDLELVIAGGLDSRIKDNVSYFKELKNKVGDYGIENQVTFMTSISDDEKAELFNKCSVLLYTPENEHFGIVPLEAGLWRRPVIACNSGGPLETVVDGKTGFLVSPDKEKWAEAMYKLVDNELAVRMGADASNHVRRNFSEEAITGKLETILRELSLKP